MNKQHYIRLSHPNAFSGVTKLSRFYKGAATRGEIERSLSSIKSYTRMREVKRPKKFNPIYVWKLRDLLQADLMDRVRRENHRNKGIKYLLVVIDTFSRKVWVRKLKTKGGKIVANAFEDILTEAAHPDFPINRLLTDRGSEFKAKDFQKVLKDNGISYQWPRFPGHAPHVERVQRTLQSKLGSYEMQYDTKSYVDAVDKAVETYNNTYHETIKMTPNQAEEIRNHDKVRAALSEYYHKAETKSGKQKTPKFKVGDRVRTAILKSDSGRRVRAFNPTFNDDIYVIRRVYKNLPRVMYGVRHINDRNQTNRRIRYYAEELQKVSGVEAGEEEEEEEE